MSKPLKPRRGTTAEQNAFIGEAYEVTYDTDKNTLVCRDGVTPGGFPLLRADQQATKDDEQDAKIAEALDKVGLPLGFEYTRLTGQTAPLGGVDYMGQTATRAMYADLWAWLNENKPDAIISESEWQSLYSSQNGNVAKYSTGDGSTTFRFPRVVGYFKGAGAVSEVGQYVKEGLPNITGAMDFLKQSNSVSLIRSTTGAYSGSEGGTSDKAGPAVGTTTTSLQRASFDASRSNAIYGNSDHVTPETVAIVMGVIAFGSVASIGEATEEGIVAELSALGAQVGALETVDEKLAAKVDGLNGTMVFDLEDGSTIEFRRAGEAGSYSVALVYVAADGTKSFVPLISTQGESLVHLVPDFSAGVGLSKGVTTTMAKHGFIVTKICSSDYYTLQLSVNGSTIAFGQDDVGHDACMTPVKGGDQVVWTGGGNVSNSVTFYPAR